MKFGLLGRKLGHSYSPMIFDLMGGYRYDLFEREPEGIEDLLRNGDFDGLNVTIPYKKEVLQYLDEVDELALRLGSVNTIVRRSGRKRGGGFGIRRYLRIVSARRVAGSGGLGLAELCIVYHDFVRRAFVAVTVGVLTGLTTRTRPSTSAAKFIPWRIAISLPWILQTPTG